MDKMAIAIDTGISTRVPACAMTKIDFHFGEMHGRHCCAIKEERKHVLSCSTGLFPKILGDILCGLGL